MGAVASVELRSSILKAVDDGMGRLETTPAMRQKAIKRCEEILENGSDRDATRIIAAMIQMERLQLERDMVAAGAGSASIRLSAPANLQDVHALLEAMRQPPVASDSILPQVASVPAPQDAPASQQPAALPPGDAASGK